MAEISRSAAALRFFGDELDPDELTELLGAAPDRAGRKGDVRVSPSGPEGVAKTGSWLLNARDRFPGDLDAQIEDLFAQLTPDLSVWRDLAERFEADLSCGLFMDRGNEMIGLSPSTLAALSARGLGFQFDIYAASMGERRLVRHPQSSGSEQLCLDAKIIRTFDDALSVTFVLSGPLSEVKLAPEEEAQRRNELWRATCFEVFAQSPVGAYFEFNLSPSTSWAAYRFDGYREGMAAAELTPPDIGVAREGDRLELMTELALGDLPGLRGAPWRVGLSAVVEDAQGRISYWALALPAGKPDFHHPDSFTLELLPDIA